MANKRVVDTYSYQETQDAMRDPDVVGMREHHKNGETELVLRPSNYPYKNNLNRTYQQAMSDDARNKAMGDYDAINVNSEELIDFTPGFQDQYDADMAKVAQNNARIQELEAIIAQKKQDEITFSKYRNNPLYKAAKFDYVVNGDRKGLDQFLADERAREEMIRQSQEAQANRDNALEIAKLGKKGVDESNEIERDKMKNLSIQRVNNAKAILATSDTAENRNKLAEAIINHNAAAAKYGWQKFDNNGNVIGDDVKSESNNSEQNGSNQEESKYSVGDAEADLAACKTSAECQTLADKLATKGDEYKNIRSKAISKAQELQKKEGDERKRQENAKAIADIVKEYTQKWLSAKNNTNKANAIIRQAKKALLAKGLSGDITANADGTGLMHVKGK